MSRHISVLIFVVVNIYRASCAENCDEVGYPEVEINTGRLAGSFVESREGRRYSQFLGIPYGHVEKRFDVS